LLLNAAGFLTVVTCRGNNGNTRKYSILYYCFGTEREKVQANLKLESNPKHDANEDDIPNPNLFIGWSCWC
jgi:hypothetical protein